MDDQTEKAWLEGHSSTGTGVLLIKSGDKTYVPNLTYAECVERCADVLAFKWVPDDIATFEELRATSCSTCEEDL